MSEKRLTVPRLGVVAADPAFRIIAALNPLDDIGISRISRALKDRFTSIRIDYQPREEEIEIVRRRAGGADNGIVELAVDIARETRKHPDLKLGASVRGSIDMVDVYRSSRDLMPGNPSGVLDDGELKTQAAFMAFRNKIWLYETSERKPEEIIREIMEKLERQKKN
jgi:MoxR-like ATPase